MRTEKNRAAGSKEVDKADIPSFPNDCCRSSTDGSFFVYEDRRKQSVRCVRPIVIITIEQ